ncbi:MAG: dihydrofolate reductase family protein [Chloroflexi bacterium]|nr:dihydrofolate reductase family protein [Chloroflexota bacterium]
MNMSALAPLETLYDPAHGVDLPLPPELARLYGRLAFPAHQGRAYVVSNFVTTLDGVVSLGVTGNAGGTAISGDNPQDHLVMGLLRAVADAVIVGAGTLRAVPDQLWTPDSICPALAGAYGELRQRLGKSGPPLNVIVTGRGEIDLGLRVFQSGEVPALIVSTPRGAQHIQEASLPPAVEIAVVAGSDRLSARAILDTVIAHRPSTLLLVEGGPHLLGDFLAERCLDELFLTLAPQIAGHDGIAGRLSLVAGKQFAPEQPLWGTLEGMKRSGSHLFLRYTLARAS